MPDRDRISSAVAVQTNGPGGAVERGKVPLDRRMEPHRAHGGARTHALRRELAEQPVNQVRSGTRGWEQVEIEPRVTHEPSADFG